MSRSTVPSSDSTSRFVVLSLISMLIVFLCFFPARSWSQATSGTLTGVVTDPSGAVVPGATVKITDTQHGNSVVTTTNAQGLFTRTQLGNGNYNVTVSAKGFQPSQQNNVIVLR